MDTIKNFTDSFVSFFQDTELTLKFGIILIFAVIGLFVLITISRLVIFLVKRIIAALSKEDTQIEATVDTKSSVPPAPINHPQDVAITQETKVISYLDEELRKFKTNMNSIYVEELKEERAVTPSPYAIDNLSHENFSELSEGKKKNIKSRFKNLSLKDLNRQHIAYTKKQQSSVESMERDGITFRALLLNRDKAENNCADLYSQHKTSLAYAKSNQEQIFSNSKNIEQDILKKKEELERKSAERSRLLAELEKNGAEINECIVEAGKVVISAYQYVEASQKCISKDCNKYREDVAAYLSSVSELNIINNDLFRCLESYTEFAKSNTEYTYALECINDDILAAQAAIEEQKRLEAEEAERIRKEKEAERERIRKEKEAERERIALMKKAEAERQAQKKAEAEKRAQEEAEQKEKEKQQAILIAQQEEILESNQKAQSALDKAEELDKRAKLLEQEKAELEEQKRVLLEERERDRVEKEKLQAAVKAEKEAREAEQKAQKAAREKAELEALEELTEEEKEMRRRLEQMNNELPSRSSTAAEEGFVDEKRLNEIRESQVTLENEQAKRIAEKEALRLSIEQNQQRILENNSALDNEDNSPEERMEAIREQWRLERENKERFEAEQARKALEVQERKKALADSNNTSEQ